MDEKSATIDLTTSDMSQKNPYKKLAHLKVIVNEDREGQSARQQLGDVMDILRPRKRADCLPGGHNEMRPCPWYGCKYHLGLDINEDTSSMAVRDLDDMVHTCDLDVAEIGGVPGSGKGAGISLEECGEIMDLTRERVRQLETRGLVELKLAPKAKELQPADYGRPVIRRKKSTVTPGDDSEAQDNQENPLASDEDKP